MATWEEGQEQAQRESRNRVFGGTRQLGGATGPVRDMSSGPNPGRGNNPFANLRSSGAGGGGIQPNYGMGDSRYSAGGGSVNFSDSITGPASSRAMRRGGRGGGDIQSGNITVQFAPQTVDQSVRTGDVLGANARQDKSINIDTSSRTFGTVGNTQSQDASGGSGGTQTNTQRQTQGGGGATKRPRTGGRVPGQVSQTPNAIRLRQSRQNRNAAMQSQANVQNAPGGAGGSNRGTVSGDITIDASSGGRRTSVFDDGPSNTAIVNSPTSVGSNNTANPSQQVGNNNPTTNNNTINKNNSRNTTNNNPPPPAPPSSPAGGGGGTPPTPPTSGGTTPRSPAPPGGGTTTPPRSTGRPAPTGGTAPTTPATPPASPTNRVRGTGVTPKPEPETPAVKPQLPMVEPEVVNNNTPTPASELPTPEKPAQKETEKKASTKQEPAKKAPEKKEPEKKASTKQEPAKKATAKKEPAKKAPAKPKAEPEKKPTAEKPQAEKKDLPKPEDVEVFINPDTGMPDTRPKKK